MFFQPNIGLTLADLVKKRRFGDLTQNLPPMDLSVPSDLPQPNQPVIPMAQKGASKLDILGNILNAAAQGFAVAQSPDPAQTLMQQIQMRRQEAMQNQQHQYETQRQEREIQARQQEAEKQRQYGTRERIGEQTFRAEEAQKERETRVSLNSQEFQNNLKLQENHNKAEIGLQELLHKYHGEDKEAAQADALELMQAKTKEERDTMIDRQIMTALMSATRYHKAANIEDVMNIIDKRNNGIALTKDDYSKINQSIQALSQATTGGISAAGVKASLKDASAVQKTRLDIIKTYYNRKSEPIINPITGQPSRDASGRIQYQFEGDPKQMDAELANILSSYDKATQPFLQQQQQRQQNLKQIQQQNGATPVITPEAQIDDLLKRNTPQGVLHIIDTSNRSEEDKQRMRRRVQAMTGTKVTTSTPFGLR